MLTISREEAVLQAWELSNLQPLEIRLNRSKQDRFIATREEILAGGILWQTNK